MWCDRLVDEACHRAEAWFRAVPAFANRVNLGSVVGFRGPTLLSEHDTVIHFARHLHEAGVPWEDMHYELSPSRAMFHDDHPAAVICRGRTKIDLALVREDDLLAADLPTSDAASFQFEAFFEFARLGDYWTVPGAHPYGAPKKGIDKVTRDVRKVATYVQTGAARLGYVIVFEECDYGFPTDFQSHVEHEYSGCRVRFLRGYG